jgi:uncharacterized protein (TIGR02001 family)
MPACSPIGKSRSVPSAAARALRRAAGLLALLAAGGVATPAAAQEFGGALGIASENIYRGQSLSAGRPVWLADLHCTIGSHWVAGLGASAERGHPRAPGAQLIAYLDRRWQVGGDWAAKIGLVHYDSAVPGAPGRLRYDEVNAAIGYRGRWQATFAVSPNAYGYYEYGQAWAHRGRTAWLETTWHQPVAARLSIEAGVGYADVGNRLGVRDYGYANLGLSYAIGGMSIYLSRIWTGRTTVAHEPYARIEAAADSRWVGSVLWTF